MDSARGTLVDTVRRYGTPATLPDMSISQLAESWRRTHLVVKGIVVVVAAALAFTVPWFVWLVFGLAGAGHGLTGVAATVAAVGLFALAVLGWRRWDERRAADSS